MLLLATGAALTTTSVIGMIRNTPKNVLKRIIKNTLIAMKLQDVKVEQVKQIEGGWSVRFHLPAGYPSHKFQEDISASIEEVTYAGGIMFRRIQGNIVEIAFGFSHFTGLMEYKKDTDSSSLQIPLYSPFGLKYLNFNDEACCHLLIGGSTRMGKSVFIRLIITQLILSTDNKADIYVIDNKITDLVMFQGVKGLRIAETIEEANSYINDVLILIDERKRKLKAKGDVVDAKEYRQKYPDENMPPVFVIIDEYARFADDKPFQEKIMLVAETAGYLDVHLIVASQRPDVQTVLKPRIRANLLTRISFTTTDEANSELILGIPDAAYLGRIQGRAILSDGFPCKVQIPYLSSDTARNLLKEYIDHDRTRQENVILPEAFPSFEPRSVGELDMPGSDESSSDNQPDRKKTRKGRGYSANPTNKR